MRTCRRCPPRPPRTKKFWDVFGRKELLFAQILGTTPNAFISNRANIKPGKDGKGGVSYDKKDLWQENILKQLSTATEFEGAAMPEYQSVLNFVERIVKANKHLYKAGMEQAEPADAGTEGTKDEQFTAWQQVRARAARACKPPPPPRRAQHARTRPSRELWLTARRLCAHRRRSLTCTRRWWTWAASPRRTRRKRRATRRQPRPRRTSCRTRARRATTARMARGLRVVDTN